MGSSRVTFEGVVGPTGPRSDGVEEAIRLGKDCSAVVSHGNGRYYEPTSRGKVYTAMTSAAGTTIVAANVTPVAAAAATILSIYNPLNSGVNAQVLKTWLNFISGTPGAGAFVYNVAYGQNITAIQNNQGSAGLGAMSNLPSGATGAVKTYVQTALTGGVAAQQLMRPMGASLFAAAIAGTTPALNFLDLVDGDLVLPPGALLSIAAPAVGTTVLVVAGIEYQEVALTSPVG
jgi:hypothetical protein